MFLICDILLRVCVLYVCTVPLCRGRNAMAGFTLGCFVFWFAMVLVVFDYDGVYISLPHRHCPCEVK